MGNKFCKFSQSLDDEGVAEARDIAKRFVAARSESAGGQERAISAVAIASRVGENDVRKLVFPSRTPKTITVGVWRRLMRTYLVYLDRKILEVENERRRVQAMADPHPRAVQALLRKAEAIIADIRAVAGE